MPPSVLFVHRGNNKWISDLSLIMFIRGWKIEQIHAGKTNQCKLNEKNYRGFTLTGMLSFMMWRKITGIVR